MQQQRETVVTKSWPYAAPQGAAEALVSKEKKEKKESDVAEGSHGQRLARIRKERGITQVELARLLGTSQAVVSDYERDVLRLNGDLIVRLAALLDVTADELLGLSQRKASGPTRDKRLARRLQAFDSLPKRDRDALTRTIDAFLSARGGPGSGRPGRAA
jgi:transcriptional regulator with XRE-family HTH domain